MGMVFYTPTRFKPIIKLAFCNFIFNKINAQSSSSSFHEPQAHHSSHPVPASTDFSAILDELASVQLIKMTLDTFNKNSDSGFYYWLAAVPLMLLAILLVSGIVGYAVTRGITKYQRIYSDNSSDSEIDHEAMREESRRKDRKGKRKRTKDRSKIKNNGIKLDDIPIGIYGQRKIESSS